MFYSPMCHNGKMRNVFFKIFSRIAVKGTISDNLGCLDTPTWWVVLKFFLFQHPFYKLCDRVTCDPPLSYIDTLTFNSSECELLHNTKSLQTYSSLNNFRDNDSLVSRVLVWLEKEDGEMRHRKMPSEDEGREVL